MILSGGPPDVVHTSALSPLSAAVNKQRQVACRLHGFCTAENVRDSSGRQLILLTDHYSEKKSGWKTTERVPQGGARRGAKGRS